jgi:hypothetical protein
MKTLTTLVAAMACAVAVTFSHANAADILVSKDKNGKDAFVWIEGDIEMGDNDKFLSVLKTLSKKPLGVFLDSRGGNVGAALNIGIMIRRLQLSTIANHQCASSCGLIWLAGTPRVVFDNSYVGFHGVYNKDTGQTTSDGNAVVGAYLSQLGFGYETIRYLTKEAPDSMEWLDSAKAKQYGIPLRVVPSKEPESKTAKRK